MDRMIDINVRGVFVRPQGALKHMKSGGRIIMIGSAVGERVLVPGLVPYSATKGAVKIFTQGLSREVGAEASRLTTCSQSDRHGFESRRGRLAVPQKAATALDRYGTLMRSLRWWRLSPSGSSYIPERILPWMAE